MQMEELQQRGLITFSDLWIIAKLTRKANVTHPTNTYYVLDSVIYEAPSLLRLLNKRLTDTATSLDEWFETVRGLWRFSLAHGYEWRTDGTTRTAAKEGAHRASKQRRTYPAGVDISLCTFKRRRFTFLADALHSRAARFARDKQTFVDEHREFCSQPPQNEFYGLQAAMPAPATAQETESGAP
mmetsp:Transcript_9968/g.28763  ORF Transcript_9968/g.28763 Transcript_9968/m.28763 type:complete len:184 (+) Transcript_9968:245-796(+)